MRSAWWVCRTIGVSAIDATLEEIENFLSNRQWGSVYAFLINREGETIFHPRLKPSTNVGAPPSGFTPKIKLAKRKSRTFANLAKCEISHTTKIYFSYWCTVQDNPYLVLHDSCNAFNEMRRHIAQLHGKL